MQPLLGHDTLATGIFAVLFGGWVVFELLLNMRLRLERKTKRHDRGSSALVFGANIAAFFVMELIANNATWAGIGGSRWDVFGVGIALGVAGLGVRLYAIRVLWEVLHSDDRHAIGPESRRIWTIPLHSQSVV